MNQFTLASWMTRRLRQAYNGYIPLVLLQIKNLISSFSLICRKAPSRLNSAVTAAAMVNKTSILMVVLEDDMSIDVYLFVMVMVVLINSNLVTRTNFVNERYDSNSNKLVWGLSMFIYRTSCDEDEERRGCGWSAAALNAIAFNFNALGTWNEPRPGSGHFIVGFCFCCLLYRAVCWPS